jgi:hypothetical protein
MKQVIGKNRECRSLSDRSLQTLPHHKFCAYYNDQPDRKAPAGGYANSRPPLGVSEQAKL